MKPVVCLLFCLTQAASYAQTTFALARYQSNGALDVAFGMSGKIQTKFKDPATQADLNAKLRDIGLFPASANAIAVGTAGNFAAIASYTATGALNTTFNGTGTRVLHLLTPPSLSAIGTGATSVANAVALKNGKIVVAGSFHGPVCSAITGSCPSWPAQFALARFNADGTLDPTFGNGGRIRTSFADLSVGCSGSEAYAVAIDASDRIVVGGTATCNSRGAFAAARYMPDGQIDSTFGIGGRTFADLAGDPSWPLVIQRIHDVATDPAGNIAASGVLYRQASFLGGSWAESSFVVLRMVPWGPLDVAFGDNGVLHVASYPAESGAWNEARAVSLLPDGRIVAGGQSWYTPQVGTAAALNFTLARMHSNGDMDSTFSSDGVIRTSFQESSGIRDIAIAGDKTLAVGASGSRIAMTRYNSNGSLDVTFGTNGRVLTRFTCSGSEAAQAVGVPQVRVGSWFLIGGTANGTIGHVCLGEAGP